ALEADETTAVIEHMSICDRCPGSLRTYEAVLDRVADAVPAQSPPPDLYQRWRETIRAEYEPTVSISMPPQPRRIRQEQAMRWAFVTTVSVLFLSGIAWFALTVWPQGLVARSTWEAMQRQIEIHRQMLVFLSAPDGRQVPLRSDVTDARGILLMQPTETSAALVAMDFPTLAPNRVYQLWLLRDNQRDSGGIFQVDEDGYAMLLITAPQPLATYRAAGITEEPAGGSLGPTSPRLVGGPL
ncbi:MAG: anti-sigma factor, partial [bacterium]|nr:anti-sigma factor [bacterium]